MDDQQIARLAAVGNALRPDWPVASLRTFLAKHFTARAYRDVALVLANVATVDPPTDTPQLMLKDWPWQIVATVSRASEAERHPSAVALSDLCAHCGRSETYCRAAVRADDDNHVYATRHDIAIQRARTERAAKTTPDDDWSPSRKPYVLPHLRAEMRAAIRAGIGVVHSLERDDRKGTP